MSQNILQIWTNLGKLQKVITNYHLMIHPCVSFRIETNLNWLFIQRQQTDQQITWLQLINEVWLS